MIDYVTDDSLRRKITHGLNKTEAVNALARDFFLVAQVNSWNVIFVGNFKVQVH